MKITDTIQLSTHFNLEEFLRSKIADECGITNTIPSLEILNNLYRLSKQMEKIRALFGGKPIIITSGFRCWELNKKVGGKQKSRHQKGLACDFYIPGMTCGDIYNTIKEYADGLTFHRCLYEFSKSGDREWIHFSINELDEKAENKFGVLGMQ